jgi:hypothetical protein
MTQPEALQEARRRWGKSAHVRAYSNGLLTVGYQADEMFTSINTERQGTGHTWEDAFADADKKATT